MAFFKILLRIGIFILVIGVILLFVFTLFTYQNIFERRFESDARPLALAVSDFPGLSARPVQFESKGETLQGNFYRSDRAAQEIDALLLFCHGFSNGSRDYLSQINFFAEQGFEVLAYDNTGCYASSGSGVGGIPMAVVNLHDVLTALGQNETYTHTPLVLMGHSWGGYAVNAVLASGEFENVKAVVSFSAPNDSLSMLIEQGRPLFGNGVTLLLPFLWAVEQIKFGQFSEYSAVGGVNQTTARVLALHSEDDPVVSLQSSLAAQADRITNPNAEIAVLSGREHNTALSKEARDYARRLAEFSDAQANGAPLSADELAALLRDCDKMQLYELDLEVMREVLAFILPALNQ